MPVQDLYIGLGCLAYALVKSDEVPGRLEPQKLEQVLENEEHGKIALYSYQLKETYQTRPEEAYQFAFRRFAANQCDLKPDVREYFIRVLQQLAHSGNGISPERAALLKRIRKDLAKLSPRNTAVLTKNGSQPTVQELNS
jgi:uncharacterized tellurite resistance protein B-like protein